jgi:hypothetical protein
MRSLFRSLVSIAALCSDVVLVHASPMEATAFLPSQATAGFTCSYPGYQTCNNPKDRSCWVKKGRKTYNIDTNYEDDDYPVGITRTVSRVLNIFPCFHLSLRSSCNFF